MSAEVITIPRELYEELKREAEILHALQAAGVNNWEGYDVAMESLS